MTIAFTAEAIQGLSARVTAGAAVAVTGCAQRHSLLRLLSTA